MLIESIVVTATELNTGVAIVKTVEIPVFTKEETGLASSIKYRADGLKIINGSGAEVDIIPLTAKEYILYTADTTISDYIPVATGNEEVIDNLKGYLNYFIVKGTAGSGHTDSLEILVYKNANF